MARGRQPKPSGETPREIPRELLKVVPIQPAHVERREDSHGMLHLRVSVPPKGLLKRVVDWLKYDYSRRYELDEFGSFFYRQVDGTTTLKTIVKRMAAHFDKSEDETEVAVIQFTKTMMTKNMLELQMPVR